MKHIRLYEEFDANEGLKDWLAKAGKFLTGLVAAPKFMEILGLISGTIGKHIDSPEMKSVAEWLVKNGQELQAKYLSAVETAIGPLMDDQSRKNTVAKELILAVAGNHAAGNNGGMPDVHAMVTKAKELFAKHYKK